MQWSLIAVVHIVNALFGASCASAENGKGQISSVFEAFGYSPACVASALTSCEFSSTKELSVDVVDSIEGTNLLLQEMKSERESSSSVLKFLLQEMKSEIGNSLSEIKAICLEIKSEEENSSSVVKTRLLQEWKSAARQDLQSERENSTSVLNSHLQEIKSAVENSSSVVKNLLQEMQSEIGNSVSEIKSIRQEIKSAIQQEMQSERENSASLLNSLLQEIKCDGGNSSSVVKTLLQEMKSTEENSSSVMKSLLQETKSEIKVILQEVKRELENVADNSQSRDCAIPGGTTAAPEGKELPKNCAELKEQGETSSGVQTVYPYGSLNPKPTTVYCDQATDGGGWTVIQSRSPLPFRENFFRNWDEYVKGFGDLKGEFWIGLDNIHALTNSSQMELRFDMEDWKDQKRWALYGIFHVGDAASKYVLRIGGYSSDAGDGMIFSDGMKFSTQDKDNDLHSGLNCAIHCKGGWWFNLCSHAHLNGEPIVGEAPHHVGILWSPFRGWYYSLKKAAMKIRPVSLGF